MPTLGTRGFSSPAWGTRDKSSRLGNRAKRPLAPRETNAWTNEKRLAKDIQKTRNLLFIVLSGINGKDIRKVFFKYSRFTGQRVAKASPCKKPYNCSFRGEVNSFKTYIFKTNISEDTAK